MNSYWIDSCQDIPCNDKLINDITTDICIVGGRNYWNFLCILFG